MINKKKKKNLDAKLAMYSLTAIGVIAMSEDATSQIFYTDVHEDMQMGDTSSFIFDIDEDKFHDLMVFQAFSATAQMVMAQRAKDTEILGKSAGDYMYPLALDANFQLDTINNDWRIRDFGTMNFQGSGAYGYWQGVTDKYIGLKLKINGKPHFGWARLDVAKNAKSFIVKDYAFEFTPGKPIKTGEGMNTYAVTALSAESINNGTALKVKFNKALDESKISSYRVFFKSANDTNRFTPQLALNLSPSRYINITKTGNNPEFTVDGSKMDIQGFNLKSGTYYQVYVLSMPDGVNAVDPILSTNNKYYSFEVESSPAGKPQVKDIGNQGNGLDVEVQFNKAADELKVGFYKVIICKSAKAAAFTIEDAKKLNPARFMDVPKTGFDLKVVLTSTFEDADGEKIKNGIKYKALVLSVADGVKSSKNILASPSDEFELVNTSDINEYSDDNSLKFSINNTNIIIHSEKLFNTATVEIMSLNGKICDRKTFAQTSVIELFESSLPSGIYLLMLNLDGKVYYKKIHLY